jgi:hypothetical protein
VNGDHADFLGRLAAVLDGARVEWYLCGSFASTHHGVPRSTQDVDVLVRMEAGALDRILAALDDDLYYVSDARQALVHGQPFNVIDRVTGWKADVMATRSAFHQSELARRQRVRILGVDVWVQSAEDTILSKLVWMKRSGGSERQARDIEGILAVSGSVLDTAYMESWLDALDVRREWEQFGTGT